ncbi:MAG: hypothetical protein GKS02_09730 [Alphaproteobacteria bacterium]|nr:hypothetical protein [Alphaproteobacteria bacterium]
MVTRFVQPNIESATSLEDTGKIPTFRALKGVVFATLLLFGTTLLSASGGAQNPYLLRGAFVKNLDNMHAEISIAWEYAGTTGRILGTI